MRTTILLGTLTTTLLLAALPLAPAMKLGDQSQECENAIHELSFQLGQGVIDDTTAKLLAQAIQTCQTQPPVSVTIGTTAASLGQFQVGSAAESLAGVGSNDCASGIATDASHATFGVQITVPSQQPTSFPNDFTFGQYVFDAASGQRTYSGSDTFVSFTASTQPQTVSVGPIQKETTGTITVLGVTVPADDGFPSAPGCAAAGAPPCQGTGFAEFNHGGLDVQVYGGLDTCGAT